MNSPQSVSTVRTAGEHNQNAAPLSKDKVSDPTAQVVDGFHRRYYQGDPTVDSARGLHTNTHYHGIETHKCPLDLWIYQEILFELRPVLVIEIGTYLGGTTLFLAHQLEALGQGTVVSIDNRELSHPEHPRVEYLLGDSNAPTTVERVKQIVNATPGPVLVIHDADHRFDTVCADLDTYAPFVTLGSYLIVEDTNVNGHPVLAEWGPGPWEAVERFLGGHAEFERDHSREKFLLTYNPGGYLRRNA